jgi:hypothetical protein
MMPLASLKSFMPITSAAPPVVPETDEAELADLVSAVTQESDIVSTTPDLAEAPQKSAISALQPMTLKPMAPMQPMTPLQPMNLQQLTPHTATPATGSPVNTTSGGSTGPVPVSASRFAKSNDPDLSNIPVPEEVAAAVRRAIEAIENAMHEPRAADVTFGPMHVTAPGQPTPMAAAAAAAAAYDEQLGAPHVNGFSSQNNVTGEQIAQANGAKSEAVLSFGELSSDGAVYPLPVLPPLAPRGKRAPVSEQRKGALRRLIAGVRRR